MARITNRTKRYLKGARVVLIHPSVLKPRKYIFLLSHIRGYTTVLGHILGSHREISGYAETWTSYQTPRDLLKLRCAAALMVTINQIAHISLIRCCITGCRSRIQYLSERTFITFSWSGDRWQRSEAWSFVPKDIEAGWGLRVKP